MTRQGLRRVTRYRGPRLLRAARGAPLVGDRRGALRWARRTLRRNPREPRAYLAPAVAGRVVRADAVLRTLHKRGPGI